MERLFLAIFLSDEAQAEIARIQETLRVQFRHSKVRWTPPEDTHATLHFLGDTPVETREALVDVLSECEWPKPFAFALTDLSAFPNKKDPKIIHVGLKNHPNATGLRVRSSKILAELGFEIDPKPWIPHVTVGRVDVRSEVLKPDAVSVRAVSFTVSSFSLVRSMPKPDGSRYERIATFQL